jgi:hypothetical protein
MQASGFSNGDIFGTGNGNRPSNAVDAPLADMSGAAVRLVQPGGYCPICNVSGDNKAQVFTACFALANYIQCDHDESCGVEIRQRMTEVTGLRVTCAKDSQCKAMNNRNFMDDNATLSTNNNVFTLCRPEFSLQANPRFASSVCSGCAVACTAATPAACIGADVSGDTYLNNAITFETALGLSQDGRNVRRYWDNEIYVDV